MEFNNNMGELSQIGIIVIVFESSKTELHIDRSTEIQAFISTYRSTYYIIENTRTLVK